MNKWYSTFPKKEYEMRFQKAQKLMNKFGFDAMLLTSKENVIYFTGLETVGWETKHRPLGVVLPASGQKPALIIAETLAIVAEVTSWITDVRLWGGWKNPNAPKDPIIGIIQAISDLGLSKSRIGMEFGYGQRIGMAQEDLQKLLEGLPGVTAVDASDLLWKLRMIKSPREIEIMRKVCQDTCKAFQVGFETARAGMTEQELAGIIFSEMSRLTNWRPSFIGIRSGKTKYPMMNVPPFDKPMEKGDLVVVDGGAYYRNYHCDMMRMISIGEPTDEQKRFFECEIESQMAGVAALKPGAMASDIAEACINVIKKKGFSQHAPALERVGHGLGLDVHEPPSLAFNNNIPLEPGMIVTVEPIWSDLPNYQIGNFALEDDVLITETGHEILTPLSKELFVVKK